MNAEKYNELTHEVAEAIDYDFFSVQGITDHLELKQEYRECFSDDEILRIEVVRAAINKLHESELVEVFEKLGFESSDISTMKRIYDKPFKLDEVQS